MVKLNKTYLILNYPISLVKQLRDPHSLKCKAPFKTLPKVTAIQWGWVVVTVMGNSRVREQVFLSNMEDGLEELPIQLRNHLEEYSRVKSGSNKMAWT